MSSNAQLLKQFGLVAEEDVAKLLGVSVKTLKNRRRDDLEVTEHTMGRNLASRHRRDKESAAWLKQ